MTNDVWAVGAAYDDYMGRWSRPLAAEFVRRLGVRPGRRWLDVGCGTGALTSAVLAGSDPVEVVGVDPAEAFLAYARSEVADPRVTFRAGDARSLPVPDRSVDAVVSGLALNFVPEPERAAAEFARVVAPGGVAAAYVWDYADGVPLIGRFWAAAAALDPATATLDERHRFPLCRPDQLADLWAGVGLSAVTVEAIELPMRFADFEDYWRPFLGGQGPAPAYAMSLAEADRDALRDLLRTRLPTAPDGSITLTARAWSVRGAAPAG